MYFRIPVLTFLIFCGFLKSYSQDYATVISGDTTYYSYYRDIMFVEKLTENCFCTDSISAVPGGVEYIGYERFYFIPSWGYFIPSRMSWLGASIVHLNNGNDVFTNDSGETITIQTQSNPGNSWVFYNYPAGNYLEAIVSGIDTMTFLGITDSVKTISLQTKNSGGIPTAGDFNNKQIWLSQNHGLLKTFSYRNFPTDTTEYNISGIQGNSQGYQHLSVQEIFDFDIGDEFHYRNRTSWSAPYSYNEWLTRTVLNKSISANGDTLKYLYDNTYYSENWSFGNVTTYFQHDTIEYPYVIFSQNEVLNGLPEEVLPGIAGWSPAPAYGYSIPFHDTNYFSRNRIFSENFYEYDSSCACFMWPVGNGIFPQRIYASGLGEIYETDPTGNVRYDSLVYYKKGNEIWGTPLNWSVILGVENSPESNYGIKAYPNPAQEKFYIELENPHDKHLSLELFTPEGNLVYQTNLSGILNEIPCSHLNSGIYFYRVTYPDGITFVNKIAVR